jgi:hypothetical protein
MAEQRRSRRKKAPQTIQVTNSISGEAIGFVGNLSIDGMLLISEPRIARQCAVPVHVRIARPCGSANRRVEIGVHEQWSEPASIPGQFWAGFRIIDIDPQDRVALGAWVNAQEDQTA